MEFIEMMKQLNRMCCEYRDKHACKGCAINDQVDGSWSGCYAFLKNRPEMTEEIVTRWMKENPPKTNLDELTQMIKRFCGDAVIVRPQVLYPGISIEPPEEAVDRFKDWLNEEYKENS